MSSFNIEEHGELQISTKNYNYTMINIEKPEYIVSFDDEEEQIILVNYLAMLD